MNQLLSAPYLGQEVPTDKLYIRVKILKYTNFNSMFGFLSLNLVFFIEKVWISKKKLGIYF